MITRQLPRRTLPLPGGSDKMRPSSQPQGPVIPISGFTIVRNGLKLGFPVVESIRSLLPVCEEVVVNVGKSDDETLDLVKSIGDPRIRILETEWDFSDRNYVFGRETMRAMRECRHPWGIYIQADEVLHEDGADELQRVIQEVDDDPEVEALLCRYLHFYGDTFTLATHRRWYRREIRTVRLDPALDIRPYQGAQGFRVGPDNRKIRARLTSAEMFHYGWARPPEYIQRKREFTRDLFPGKEKEQLPLLPWEPLIKPFRGKHPAVAAEWAEQRRTPAGERRVDDPKYGWDAFRFYLSDVIERVTGERVFEFRNYTLV
jgi:hypothetical protein